MKHLTALIPTNANNNRGWLGKANIPATVNRPSGKTLAFKKFYITRTTSSNSAGTIGSRIRLPCTKIFNKNESTRYACRTGNSNAVSDRRIKIAPVLEHKLTAGDHSANMYSLSSFHIQSMTHK